MLTQNFDRREEGDTPPVALCRSLKTRTSEGPGWTLVVDQCPFCGLSHAHGGGTGTEPRYGLRISTCADRNKRSGYSLAPAGGAS